MTRVGKFDTLLVVMHGDGCVYRRLWRVILAQSAASTACLYGLLLQRLKLLCGDSFYTATASLWRQRIPKIVTGAPIQNEHPRHSSYMSHVLYVSCSDALGELALTAYEMRCH